MRSCTAMLIVSFLVCLGSAAFGRKAAPLRCTRGSLVADYTLSFSGKARQAAGCAPCRLALDIPKSARSMRGGRTKIPLARKSRTPRTCPEWTCRGARPAPSRRHRHRPMPIRPVHHGSIPPVRENPWPWRAALPRRRSTCSRHSCNSCASSRRARPPKCLLRGT